MGSYKPSFRIAMLLAALFCATNAFAGDADINLPDLTQVTFPGVGLGGHALLYLGLACCVVGALFGFLNTAGAARCRCTRP